MMGDPRDAVARQNGFQNYAQMSAWQAQREASLQRPMDYNIGTARPQPQGQPQPAPPPPQQQPGLLGGFASALQRIQKALGY